ncbi:MAG: HAMP domain-containing histidine kinase [Chitinophagales bacterium]|nr:HAMP domain-containing histidine kinase [Chitinophagales bacterium]
MPAVKFAYNPFAVFYVVFTYIIIFSLWWGYLLYAKNETAFKEKVELNEQQFYRINPGGNYQKTAEYKQLLNKHYRQRVMIIAEGSVFFVLLFAGLLVVRRVFKREIELAAQQRNFLLSITHELKSPLSTIKLSLQTMMKRKLEQEQSEKLINNSLSDLDRLEALVDNMLFAAKIEREEHGFSNEALNVSEITERILDRFASNRKEIEIRANIEKDINLPIDQLGFTSVVTNLIENAIKYSEPKTLIKIELLKTEHSVELRVCDEGTGIPEEERENVFKKFYRIGNEDTRKTKGTGLGLYIVKRFVEIYRGSITIEDNKPRGTAFRLKFPFK